MDDTNEVLAPPARLAVTYASPDIRSAFALLLRFDARLAAIIANANDPLFGQMKLAWWRDALSAEMHNRPRGEPFLAALFTANNATLTAAAVGLVDAWEHLLVEGNWPEPTIGKFAMARGAAVFETYAEMAALPEYPQLLARQWAIDDLRLRFGAKAAAGVAVRPNLPRLRQLRPLTILAMSVREISGPRLMWHALTGR